MTAKGEGGGLFSRLRAGIRKTQERLSSVLGGSRKADEATLELLEEALFEADVGERTTSRLLERIRQDKGKGG